MWHSVATTKRIVDLVVNEPSIAPPNCVYEFDENYTFKLVDAILSAVNADELLDAARAQHGIKPPEKTH